MRVRHLVPHEWRAEGARVLVPHEWRAAGAGCTGYVAWMAGQRGYDVIVVGTGPGGATVSRELSRAGARADRRAWRRHAPYRQGPAGTSRAVAPRSQPVSLGSLSVLRGVTLGGSSMYFFGTAWEPPHEALAPHGLDLRADADALRGELRPEPLPRA